jgi:hypothetical protein
MHTPSLGLQDDFRKAKEKALYRKKGNEPQGMYL